MGTSFGPGFGRQQALPGEVVGCLAAVLVAGALGLWLLHHTALEMARHASCGANMRQISSSLMQYTQDWDDHFPPPRPPRTGSLTDVLLPYAKQADVFRCPTRMSTPVGYCLTIGGGASAKSIVKPATTVAIAEGSDIDHLLFAHLKHTAWLAFVDGHAMYYTRAHVAAGSGLIWPGLGGQAPAAGP